MRKTKFVNNEYYHIYNRGVDKRDVFMENGDYARFLKGMKEFNVPDPIGSLYAQKRCPTPFRGVGHLTHPIEIVCYSLISNHYHFILKQIVEGGISEFMKRLSGGYTNYFNKKYDCSGSLFQGTFKSIHIDSNEYLLWLSGYINGNAEIHKIAKAEDWQWGSCKDYFGLRDGTLCNKKIILSQFSNLEEYKDFVDMAVKESRKRKDLEEYLLE